MLGAHRTSWREPMPGAPKKAAGVSPGGLLTRIVGRNYSRVTMTVIS